MKNASSILKHAQSEILRNGLSVGGYARSPAGAPNGGKLIGWEDALNCPLCMLGAIGKAAQIPTTALKYSFDDTSGSGRLLNAQALAAIAYLYQAVTELWPEAESGAQSSFRQMRIIADYNDRANSKEQVGKVFERAIAKAVADGK